MKTTRFAKALIGIVTAGSLLAASTASALAHRDEYRNRWSYEHHHKYKPQPRKPVVRSYTYNYYNVVPQPRPQPRQTYNTYNSYGNGSALNGSSYGCNSNLVGALLGGATGALLGSQIGKGSGNTVAIIGGAIVGVLAGQAIGANIDANNRNCVSRTLETVPDGQVVVWNEPRSEGATQPAQQSIMPVNTWQTAGGRYCREYLTTGTVGGQAQQVYGTACRNPDGSWQIVS